MVRASIAKELWVSARNLWEADPTVTFSQIARSLGTSRQAVQISASRNGWVKRAFSQDLTSLAHSAADKKNFESRVDTEPHGCFVVSRDFENYRTEPSSQLIDIPQACSSQMAQEVAVQRRAEVLETHRKEWLAVRNQAWVALKTQDREQARHVKVVAESIKIIQEGERKAWGMDMDDGKKPPTVQVVINRRSGVRIGQS